MQSYNIFDQFTFTVKLELVGPWYWVKFLLDQ